VLSLARKEDDNFDYLLEGLSKKKFPHVGLKVGSSGEEIFDMFKRVYLLTGTFDDALEVI